MVKRPKSHVVEDRSRETCRSLLPSEWIFRDLPCDYGVDMEVEIVEADLVTGKRLWFQLKGTESPDLRGKFVAFETDVKLLEYSLRCDFPLLLVVVDTLKKEAYWLPLRDEVESNLELKNPKWREQKYAIVHIPLSNSFSEEKDRDYFGLRWYAMETARMRAFSIMHYYYHELMYTYPWNVSVLETDLSEDEVKMLVAGLEKTKSYLSLTLEFDSLFGSHGCDLIILMAKSKIEEGIRCCDTILQRIRRGEKPFDPSLESVDLSIFKAHSAVESLTSSISFYHYAKERFLYHEEP
jgi:hypothetical protein